MIQWFRTDFVLPKTDLRNENAFKQSIEVYISDGENIEISRYSYAVKGWSGENTRSWKPTYWIYKEMILPDTN